MTKAENEKDKDGKERRTSVERYLLMDEKQKDAEIQKAVIRLQKRIQEILYVLETDTHPERGSKRKKKNE